ncbi:hypothetical protein [Prevotella koreensis]
MKKIMFNDKYCLTSAVLNRTKTMTRRLLKHGTPLSNWEETQKNLPYKVGDIVAIAQCYEVMYAEMIADFTKHNYHIPREDAAEKFKKVYESYAGWKNKMFVKADLMKHHIRITDVKVERLQDISEEDIMREGVWQNYDIKNIYFISKTIGYAQDIAFTNAHEAYWYLINKICGKGTLESNPWVLAYSFELIN